MLFTFFHVTHDIKARHLRLRIAAHGDGFLEMSGELALTIVRHADGTCFAGSDRLLGVGRHSAAAAGHGLVDDKRCVARVREGERTLLNGLAFGEVAEIMLHLVELDFCLFLGQGIAQ